jgi:hypothetical protein
LEKKRKNKQKKGGKLEKKWKSEKKMKKWKKERGMHRGNTVAIYNILKEKITK